MEQVNRILSEIDTEYCQNHCYLKPACNNSCTIYNIRQKIIGLKMELSPIDIVKCHICGGKNQEIWYDNNRGGLSASKYCPACGRKL